MNEARELINIGGVLINANKFLAIVPNVENNTCQVMFENGEYVDLGFADARIEDLIHAVLVNNGYFSDDFDSEYKKYGLQ
jgi:hypothetical protein